MNKNGITVLSLFDGMSCGQIALDKLHINVDKYYASEIKPHGIAVTQKNYPGTIQLGDITKISYDNGILKVFESRDEMVKYYNDDKNINYRSFEIGNIDLLMGGSPCQNFSIACITNKREGLKGDKSTLFYEYLRLLKEVKPKYFLLENVGSMINDERDKISNYLKVHPMRINSKLVSGALRDRYYWTNIEVKNNPVDKNIKFQDILTSGYVNKDKSPCLLESNSRPPSDKLRLTRRYLEKSFIPIVFESKEHYEELIEHYNTYYKGLSAKEVDEIRDTIDNSIYEKVRTLNNTEMERLQTVPEGYTDILNEKQSASLLGDGWTVDVIAHILSFANFNTYKEN